MKQEELADSIDEKLVMVSLHLRVLLHHVMQSLS